VEDILVQQPGEWTPLDVVRAIESLLMHTAHLLRRVRWFKLLCDSQLAWSSADDFEGSAHIIPKDAPLRCTKWHQNKWRNLLQLEFLGTPSPIVDPHTGLFG
jgi:hypothetical protein